MTLLVPSTLFILGLLIGSFLNVCIYRLPRELSIVQPRSHCTHCDQMVRWFDNIPLLSFILLRGRCRSCRERISIQYPIVELITAFSSLFVFLKFGGGLPYALYFLLLVSPLIAITFIDLEHRIIPDFFSLPGILLGTITTLLVSGLPIVMALLHSLSGILAGGGTLFLVSWAYEKIRHQEGIGGGDIKLAAMLGAFFGWKGIFLVLFFSSLLGSIVGILLVIYFKFHKGRGHKGLQAAIPFGPFLAGGALLHLFYGREILQWYLGRTLIMFN